MARVIWRTGKIGIMVMVPLLIMGLVFYALNVLVFGQAADTSVATTSVTQWDEALAFRENGDWYEAEQIYQILIEENAGTDTALKAAKELTLMYIESEQSQKADVQYVAVRDGYGGQSGQAKTLVQIGDRYRLARDYGEARLVYGDVLKMYPNDEQALWAEAGLVIAGVLSNTGERDMTEINAFLNAHSQDKRMADVTYQIANTCRDAKQLEEARVLYRSVADRWPQADNAFWSRMGLAIADIGLGERHKAAEGFVQMVADYGRDARISVAGCLIADAYRHEGDHAKAREIYKSVVDTWSDTEHALWCRMGLVLSDIALNNDPVDITAELNELLTRFAGDTRLPNSIHQIAEQYHGYSKPEEAALLYQYVLTNWPDADQTVWCRMGLSVLECHKNKDPNTWPELESLLTAEAGNPLLPLASFLVGEEYRNIAVEYLQARNEGTANEAFSKAARIWERIIDVVPESDYTAESWYQLADCYYCLGRYSDAIALYQHITDTWPGFKLSWHCQFLVGYRYNELKKSGRVSASEADPQIRQAYSRLVQLYPYCPAATAASDWLSRQSN